jgi:8-oxo-dGTP diphosphatase
MPYTYYYPRPMVAVDLAVIAERPNTYPLILMIRRGKDPYKGHLAFPGGFLNLDETSEDAANRELKEETGFLLPQPPRFFMVADKVDRDPRGRIISLVYVTDFVSWDEPPKVAASEALWIPFTDWVAKDYPMACDHNDIFRRLLKEYEYMNELCGLCSRTNCHGCPCR